MDHARTATAWLRLLVEGCCPSDVQDLRTDLLAVTPDHGARSDVERAAGLAETLRARLAEQERDGRELRVLNDLARRLGTMHDSRGLLQEVASHSRHLLGVDVAYLILPMPDDPAGLRIEIVDGSLGTALHGLVLHEGEGIAGQVMRTGRPLWSEAYLDDERLTRVRSVDAGAVAEHLGGILGVPLRVGNQTSGVLCAADRRPRRFSEHEVELLSNLAAHAAVALRNAQLFEAERRAVADLRDTNVQLERTDAARRRASELRERLMTEVLRGAGLPDLASVLSGTTGRPVQILDGDGARRDGATTAGDVDVVAATGGPPSVWPRPTRRTVEVDGGSLVVVPVRLRDECAGCLATVVAEADACDDVVRLLEIGAMAAGLVIAVDRGAVEARLRSRGELLGALLSADSDQESLGRRAAAMGVDLAAVRCVVVLEGPGADVRALAAAGNRLASAVDGWVAEHAGRFVVLTTAAPDAVRERLGAVGSVPAEAAAGVAGVGDGVPGLRAGYRDARQTAALLLALGRGGTAAAVEDAGPYRTLFSHAGRRDLETFVDRTVGPVLAYDRARGRDLTGTLRTYLAQAQQHARTCEALHIHANTLYQRLERLDGLLGAGWRDPERTLELQLALHLRSLAGTFGAGSDDAGDHT